MDSRHQKSAQQFASIEAQLARLGMNPQAPIIQSPQPDQVQYQAVPLLEQGAATAGPPPPPVPPPSRQVVTANMQTGWEPLAAPIGANSYVS